MSPRCRPPNSTRFGNGPSGSERATDDMLRAAVKAETELGLQAKRE